MAQAAARGRCRWGKIVGKEAEVIAGGSYRDGGETSNGLRGGSQATCRPPTHLPHAAAFPGAAVGWEGGAGGLNLK